MDEEMINNSYKDSKAWLFMVRIFELPYFFTYKKIGRILIKELKKEVTALEPIERTNSEANNEWIQYANQVREMVLSEDPSIFLRWAPIRDTMNVTNSKFIIKELADLKKILDWDSLWRNTIIEEKIGGQLPFILYPKSSGNTIHLTYIISKFKEKTGKNFIDLDFIFEFGGGYGNLCRLIHKLGFQGKYIIFDFPIFSILQKFYLKLSGLSTYEKKEINNRRKGIFLLNNMKDLKVLEITSPNKDKNLFVATWSLSETSLKNREAVWEFLPNFGYFMMGYQDKFGEVNNRDYFEKLKKECNDIVWYDWPLRQLPAHNLLMGKKK